MPVLQAPHITAQLLVDALCGLIKGQMGGLSIARALQHQPLHDMTNYITMKAVMRRRAEGYLSRNCSREIFIGHGLQPVGDKIGRASCRERGCKYGEIRVVAG